MCEPPSKSSDDTSVNAFSIVEKFQNDGILTRRTASQSG
jgi:hypothetical protein